LILRRNLIPFCESDYCMVFVAGSWQMGTLEPERAAEIDESPGAEAGAGRSAAPADWVRVTATSGKPNAIIVAGRLESCGIPTHVTQEAIGARVFALTVGPLGTAHVWVPKEHAAQAKAILATEWEEEE
jgi:hypothetical protein